MLKEISEYIVAMAFVEGILKPSVVYITQGITDFLVEIVLDSVDNLIVDSALRKQWKEEPISFVLERVALMRWVPNKVEVALLAFDAFRKDVFEEKTGVCYDD